jgi:hypothetical protein
MALVCGGVGIVSLVTLDAGQNWGDDWANYLLVAQGYLRGEFPPGGHSVVPPLYPLLLAPFLAAFGIAFKAMKLVNVVAWVANGWFLHRLFSLRLPRREALLATAIFVTAPWFFYFKQSLFSDAPFLFFATAALYFFERTRDAHAVGRPWLRPFAAFCAFAVLACLTRLAGVALLGAALVGVPLFRLPRRALLVLALSVAAWLAIDWATARSLDYYTKLPEYGGGAAVGLRAALEAKLLYASYSLNQVPQFFFPVYRPIMQQPYLHGLVSNPRGSPAAFYYEREMLLIAPWMGLGLVLWVRRRGIGFLELVAAAYLAVTAWWGVAGGTRYQLPLVEVALLWMVGALLWARERLRAPALRFWLGRAPLFLALAYNAGATVLTWNFSDDDVGRPEAREMLTWVETRTPPDARVWFEKPRALRLLTGRQGFGWGAGDGGAADAPGVGKVIRDSAVEYVVLELSGPREFRDALAKGLPLETLATNARYRLYRVGPAP